MQPLSTAKTHGRPAAPDEVGDPILLLTADTTPIARCLEGAGVAAGILGALLQSCAQFGLQVLDILNTHREADQARADAKRVAHGGGQ
jgi:hypothetical protein